jgi:hypothetical protein
MSDRDGHFHPGLFNFPARLGVAFELGVFQEGERPAGRDFRALFGCLGIPELDYVSGTGSVSHEPLGVVA